MNIAEQFEICTKATAGPWKSRKSPVDKGYKCIYFGKSPEEPYCTSALEPKDADFVAHARTNYPLALQTLLAIRTLCESESGELAGKVLKLVENNS